MKKGGIFYLFGLVIFSTFVFAAGGTHTASEILGGTFADRSPYSIGAVSDSQYLTLYQTGVNPVSILGGNKLSGGYAIKGAAEEGTGTTGVGIYGTAVSGLGVFGSSASGVGVEGVTTSGYSGFFSGGKFMVVNAGESTTQADLKGKLDNAGVIVSTDYTADAFTPGFFWQTGNNNDAKPKAGIYLKETGAGTYMYFGTSNSYVTGITNNGLVIDPSGNVDAAGKVTGTSLCIGATCWTAWPAVCAAGSSIRGIAADGTVTCEADDVGLAAESDPEVDALTATKWCKAVASGGTPAVVIKCDQDAPSGGVTGSGTAGYIPTFSTGTALADSIVYQDSDSEIGIGTTAPAEKLEVRGNILASVANSGGTLTEWIEMWPTDSAIIAKSNNPIRFGHATSPDATGWTERMRINTDGDLEVTGKVKFKGDATATTFANMIHIIGTHTISEYTDRWPNPLNFLRINECPSGYAPLMRKWGSAECAGGGSGCGGCSGTKGWSIATDKFVCDYHFEKPEGGCGSAPCDATGWTETICMGN